jgi:hypothetical protein
MENNIKTKLDELNKEESNAILFITQEYNLISYYIKLMCEEITLQEFLSKVKSIRSEQNELSQKELEISSFRHGKD